MPSILTKKYRKFLAEQFLTAVADSNTGAYIFIGRPQTWSDTANNAVNDSNPPIPEPSFQTIDYDVWRDMIGAKRIDPANTALVIKRFDWTSNTVYAQYDDQDAELFTPTLKNFYVLDASINPIKVYKCLWNNDGAPSTVAPSTIGSATVPTATSDGYVWQYMYFIPSDQYKFLTTNWMPVLSAPAVQNVASTYAGRLPTAVPLVVENGGASYNAAANVTTTIIGDGTGATVTSGVTIAGGVVTGVTLALGGLGYSTVDSINVYQSGATTAEVRAIIPPYPNHGYDPVKELGCSSVLCTTQFAYSEDGELTTVNNYRRIGLVINPKKANGDPANAVFYRQTTNLNVTSNTGVLHPDDVIYNSSKASAPTATVVDVVTNVSNNYVVRLTTVNDKGETSPFSDGDVIVCEESGVSVTINTVDSPELSPFTGEVIYVDQRTPVTRSADQIEEVKVVFQIG